MDKKVGTKTRISYAPGHDLKVETSFAATASPYDKCRMALGSIDHMRLNQAGNKRSQCHPQLDIKHYVALLSVQITLFGTFRTAFHSTASGKNLHKHTMSSNPAHYNVV